MLKINKLCIKMNTGRVLIDNLSLVLNSGDKLAIIGEEGNGKSTLLKAIFDKSLIENFCEINGEIVLKNKKIGYLKQTLDEYWNDVFVIDFFLKNNYDSDIDFDKYNKIKLLEKILIDLNFDIKYIRTDMIISNLSGGEKVKLQLAKIMFENPDLILLDEPTNDLDIDTIILLEEFIKKSIQPLIFISHDEVLLENTATSILHMEQLMNKNNSKHTLKKVGYKQYVFERKNQIEHQTQIAYAQRRDQKEKLIILNQIKQKVKNALDSSKKDPSTGRILAKKMANIKAVERRYENEEIVEVPIVEDAINLFNDNSVMLSNKKRILDMNLKSISAGEKVLSKNICLTVLGNDKIVITGKNGCGKSTLIKQIIKDIEFTSAIKVGYFSQDYRDVLNFENTPIIELENLNKSKNVRTFLASMRFTKEEVETSIKFLSEGQKAKIAILKLILSQCNVLVLDEPTRNLSPLTNPIIRKILIDFKGCLISVSHDRKFINDVCNSVFLMNENGLVKIDKL